MAMTEYDILTEGRIRFPLIYRVSEVDGLGLYEDMADGLCRRCVDPNLKCSTVRTDPCQPAK